MLPEEALLLVCAFLEDSDVARLMCCDTHLNRTLRSDRVWKLLFFRKFNRRVSKAERRRLLGNGFYRLFRYQLQHKDIKRIGKTLDIGSPIAQKFQVNSLACLPGGDKTLIAAFGPENRLALLSVAQELKAVWVCDPKQQANVIEQDYIRDLKRQDLDAEHKNELFHLAFKPRTYYEEGFDVWAASKVGASVSSCPALDDKTKAGALKTAVRRSNSCSESGGHAGLKEGANSKQGNKVQARRRSNGSQYDSVPSPLYSSGDEISSSFGSDHSSELFSPPTSQSLEDHWEAVKSGSMTRSQSSSSLESESHSEGDSSSSVYSASSSVAISKDRYPLRDKKGRKIKTKKKGKKPGSHGSRNAKLSWESRKGSFVDHMASSTNPPYAVDPQKCCASLSLQDDPAHLASWYLLHVGDYGCRQNKLVVPRWSRNSDAPLVCSAFTSLLVAQDQKLDQLLAGRAFVKGEGCGDALEALGPVKEQLADNHRGARPKLEEGQVIAATGHKNGTILLWGKGCAFLGAIHTGPHAVTALIVEDGFCLSGHANGSINAWEPRSARKLSAMVCPPPEKEQVPSGDAAAVRKEALAVWRDLVVAGSGSGWVYIWLRSGRLLFKYKAHDGRVLCLRLSAVDQSNAEFVIATGGADRTAHVKRLRYSTAVSPNRKSDTEREPTRLFQALHIDEIAEKRLVGHDGPVRDVHVDDIKVVSCSDDGTIRYWDVDPRADVAADENHFETSAPKTIRTIRWKGPRARTPIVSMLVGATFVVGLRSDGSLVAFTYQSQWASLSSSSSSKRKGDLVTSTRTPSRARSGSASASSSKRASKYNSSSKSSSKTKKMISREEVMEMLFEDQFYEGY